MKKKINILIIGAGNGGVSLVEMFSNDETVNMLGLVDINPEAPGIKLARKKSIPTAADWKEFIKDKTLDEIIDVSGSREVYEALAMEKPAGVGIMGGTGAKMMWQLFGDRKKAQRIIKENREVVKEINKALEEEVRERRRTEDATLNILEDLSGEKKKLEGIMESIAEGITILDMSGKITAVNKAALLQHGYTKEEVIGKTPAEVFVDRKEIPKFQDAIKKLRGGEVIRNQEYFARRKDGTNFWVNVSLSLLRGEGGHPEAIVAAHGDITGRKRAEKIIEDNRKELERANVQLKEVDKLKTAFISTASHELRTPLTAIKEGIAIVADGTAGPLNGEQNDFLDTAKRNVDRLARLINDLLDFQRLEAKRMQFKMEKGDINTIIREISKQMLPAVTSRNLKLTLALDEKLPEIIFDSDKIAQVLTNLISNALGATEKGGIEIASKRAGNAVCVSVSDTGAGIKKEDMPRLFRSFSQIETKTGRKVGGTGLGLVISKSIIEAHRGKIAVDSKYGKGTTFSFFLPIDERRG